MRVGESHYVSYYKRLGVCPKLATSYSGGRIHDKRIAEATPYPLPAGSRLLQDLGFLAFTLPQVEILMPTKKPRGQELTREQQAANQALTQRRLRIEHVNSRVKRCRIGALR